MPLYIQLSFGFHIEHGEELMVGYFPERLPIDTQRWRYRLELIRAKMHHLTAVAKRTYQLQCNPAATETRQFRCVQTVLEKLGNRSRVQNRHPMVLERKLLLVRHAGALCLVVLAA